MGSGRLKRDYSKKSYSNALFNKRKIALKKKKRDANVKFILYFLAGIFVIAGIAYFFYGNYFRISSVEIKGNKEVKSYEVIDYIYGRLNRSKIIPFYNYWLVNDKLGEEVKNSFYFKEVKITKKLPDKIFIEAAEKEPKFILTYNSQDYLLDDKGTSMGPLSDEKKEKFFDLLKIKDIAEIKTLDDVQMVSTKEIFIIYKTLNFLEKNNFKLNYIEKRDFNEVDFILDNGIKIQLDAEENIDKQLAKLDSAKEDMDEITEYIDARFGDKVYYK